MNPGRRSGLVLSRRNCESSGSRRGRGSVNMVSGSHSESPTVVLRISDGSCQMHRAFSDFSQAVRCGRGLCRGRVHGRHDLGDGPVPDGFRAAVAENGRVRKPARWSRDPRKKRGKRALSPKNPGKTQKIGRFPRISLDVFGIIVENERPGASVIVLKGEGRPTGSRKVRQRPLTGGRIVHGQESRTQSRRNQGGSRDRRQVGRQARDQDRDSTAPWPRRPGLSKKQVASVFEALHE